MPGAPTFRDVILDPCHCKGMQSVPGSCEYGAGWLEQEPHTRGPQLCATKAGFLNYRRSCPVKADGAWDVPVTWLKLKAKKPDAKR